MLKIEFETDNAAFHDYSEAANVLDDYMKRCEVRRILYRLTEDIACGRSNGSCVDANGNVVGSWSLA